MPPLHTYSDDKAIYSVDMMLAFLNTHKHPVVKLPMSDFTWQLEQDVWGDWSPADVLKKMDGKKWAINANRIRQADLSYPVIVTGSKHVLVDGYHRVAKAHLRGDTTVKAHVFDAALMKKFIIDKDLVHRRASLTMEIREMIEIYAKRFC
jgi:hypothetical protein